ncbi:hypothetical protein HRE53_18705 [Acaryochloris sp. 'Moss Beach']|nr:hypothetical protein [Acaryochloris sp. 'Moss Beach']UJB68529.1 hypothetical protein HRE53_18705 [Acaryochloris sp. 'Moss Beach']
MEQPPRISAYTSASQRQEAAQFLDPLSVHQLLDEIAEQHQTLKAKLKK